MSNPPYQITVVTHTHWDREWYRPFQEFRLQLVAMIDDLLDLLARDPDFKSFLLDGQTIILEDYLDIRPERKADLQRYIGEGRLTIGPWHILPDEFLVSPEATVRNLMLGAKLCAEFGARMPLGYTPDPFGHIGQLPQILAGVGLDGVVLQRGLADEPMELWWEAPDGTRLFMHYLRFGYGNLAWVPPSPQAFVKSVDRWIERMHPYAATPHLLMANGTDHMMPQPGLPGLIAAANTRMAGRARLEHGTLPGFVSAVRAALGERIHDLPVVRGELRDPKRFNLLPGVLSARMWIKQRNHAAQVALEKYAEPLSAFVGMMSPHPPLCGLRSAQTAALPASPALTYRGGGERTPARREGGETLTLGPSLVGGTPPPTPLPLSTTGGQVEAAARRRGELWRAWRYLIENHPHDSICGCSIDQVHHEMATRFDWTDQIAKQVADGALRELASSINTALLPSPSLSGGVGGGDIPPTHAFVQGQGDRALIVFNPAQTAAAGRVEVAVPWAGAGRTYELLDEDGNAVAHQWLSAAGYRIDQQRTLSHDEVMAFIDDVEVGFYGWRLIRDVRVWLAEDGKSARLELVFPEYHTGEIGDFAELANALRRDMANVETCELTIYLAGFNRLAFVARDVPGIGYKTYRLRNVAAVSPTLTPLSRDEHSLENEFLRVTVNVEDGTLRLVDKARNVEYARLHLFEDTADRGDEYNYCPVDNDSPLALKQAPRIQSLTGSRNGDTLTIFCHYAVPRALAPDRASRVTEEASVWCRTVVTLTPGLARLDIRTAVTNNAEDHRFRVLFPTPIMSDVAIADGHFDRVKRVPFTGYDPAEYQEQPVPTAPMRTFVAVTDGQKGLMLAAKGLPEYELIPPDGDSGATLALTLLRCVGWLSREDLTNRKGHAGPELETPEAQCLGRHTFEYSLIPFGDNLDEAAQLAYQFEAQLLALTVPIGEGTLPPSAALVKVEPDALVVTSIKPAERGEGMIVRFYNSSETAVAGRVRFGLPAREVVTTNLLEEAQGEPLALDADRAFDIEVAPKRIITLLVR